MHFYSNPENLVNPAEIFVRAKFAGLVKKNGGIPDLPQPSSNPEHP